MEDFLIAVYLIGFEHNKAIKHHKFSQYNQSSFLLIKKMINSDQSNSNTCGMNRRLKKVR
jgi:hypothetical protein